MATPPPRPPYAIAHLDDIPATAYDGSHGFDEVGATRDLLGCLGALEREARLLVKLHPLQPVEPLRSLLAASPQTIVVPAHVADVPELIHASDIVVGFFSNLLLEAEALKRPVLRYYPGNRASDPLAHLMLGTIAGSASELATELGRLCALAVRAREMRAREMKDRS